MLDSKPPSDSRADALLARRNEWYAMLTPAQKLEVVAELSAAAQACALAEIRTLYPQADDAELRKRLFARLHGRELAIRMLRWDPEVEGW